MLCRLEVLALIGAVFALVASGAARAERPASGLSGARASLVAPGSSVARTSSEAPTASVAPTASLVQANLAPHPAPEQPLPYSHKTHVGLGLACSLCHVNPEPGEEMTFPNTATCMSCHTTLVADRPAIQKLAEYAHSKQPIPWVRVYKLLPGVTWSHRKHLEAGVPCETCHGAVGNLEVMSEVTAITGMASCISCHQTRRVSAACNVCHAWPAK
jgi:hypothetical protein